MSWRGMTGIVAAATGLAFLVETGPVASTGATATERTLCSDAGTALAIQPDGRILLGGSAFTNEIIEEPSGDHAHVGDFAVVRYLPDGEIDPSFGRNGRAITDLRDFDTINALEVADDGIVAVGSTGWNEDGSIGDNDLALVRYRTDGRLDRHFGDQGKLVLDLGGDDAATAVAVDRLGRTVVAGRSTDGDNTRAVLLRLTPDGQLDPTFGQHGRRWFPAADGFHGIEIGSQGRIVAAGPTTVDGSAAIVVARFHGTGRRQMSFGGDGKTITVLPGTQAGSEGSLALRAGRILATLDVTGQAGGRVAAARYLANGALDPRFGDDGQLRLDPPGDLPSVGATAVGPGSRPVLAGTTYSDDFATGQATLTRLDARGRPDPSFGDDGTVAESFQLEYAAYHGVELTSHGSILAAGWDFSEGHDLPRSDYVLARYTRDGSLDERFGDGGLVFTDVRDGRLACREYDHDH